jgi:elongation factor G
MAKLSSEDLRNVGVVGHADTGKTTLVSSCLFTMGATTRRGRVEDGNTVTDFDEEEVERQISISMAAAHGEWKKHDITFVDTPGYTVFRAEAKAAMRVVDSALLLVDALHGAELMTEKSWEYAREYNVPTVMVINRLDRENAEFAHALESVHDLFGRKVVPIQLPIGEGQEFRGIVDLVRMQAFEYEHDGDGRGKPTEIPEEMQDAVASAHEELVEMVAENNEALMEAYFETGDLDRQQLVEGLHNAVRKRRIVPVVCASAAHGIGIDRVLDACVELLPSPAERPELLGHNEDGEPEWYMADSSAAFSALVFKTLADPFAGHISLMRVFGGTAKADSHVVNVRTGDTERLGNLALPQGKSLEPVQEVIAGQICAVAKLKGTNTNDTLRHKSSNMLIEPVPFPTAAISFAVEPESKGDEEKISNAIARLLEEDPTLQVERDAQTHELLVSGLGQLHVEVTLAKMKRRFGVNAKLHAPTVPYRETIRRPAEAEGRHKKQSGGRGQFAVAKIVVSPLPRGGGFEFVDKIFGGSISQSYRPAVQKGVIESAQRGTLAGYPLVDFKVELTDGKEHAVDSSEMAFKIAGSLAFKEATPKASPVLLEPVMSIEVTVPEESTGDVMGDLNSRRGRVQGMDPRKGRTIIRAEVPLAEILTYAVDLGSMTGGRGTYTMEFTRYDEVPPNVAQRIIQAAKSDDGAD